MTDRLRLGRRDETRSKIETDIYPSSSSTSSTDGRFGATVGAGALVGPLDIKAQLEILDFGHTSGSMAIMVNVGYNFFKSTSTSSW